MPKAVASASPDDGSLSCENGNSHSTEPDVENQKIAQNADNYGATPMAVKPSEKGTESRSGPVRSGPVSSTGSTCGTCY